MLQIDRFKVEERMAQLRMNYNDLAEAYGCKRQWIHKLVSQKHKRTESKTVGKLADALEINPSEIIKRVMEETK